MKKPIRGFEGLYEVDDCGNVYSLRKGIVLKPHFLDKGYAQYALSKNGKRKLILGHRLVAEAFIENPNNYPIINHKDENKQNNNSDNLEWCTYSYNSNYGSMVEYHKQNDCWKKGVEATKKPVYQMLNGKVINEFESLMEASRKTNTNYSCISACCKGNRKKSNKFEWKYKEV